MVESTEQFDVDYAALAALGAPLEEFREAWEFYLQRDPLTMTTGISGATDAQRVIVYGDEKTAVEYFVGLSVDPERHLVWLRWIDACPMEI